MLHTNGFHDQCDKQAKSETRRPYTADMICAKEHAGSGSDSFCGYFAVENAMVSAINIIRLDFSIKAYIGSLRRKIGDRNITGKPENTIFRDR